LQGTERRAHKAALHLEGLGFNHSHGFLKQLLLLLLVGVVSLLGLEVVRNADKTKNYKKK